MKDDKLKSYLSERFKDYAQPVSDDLWSYIAEDIPTKKKSREILFTIGKISAAAIIILAIILLLPKNTKEIKVIAENTEKQEITIIDTITTKNIIAQNIIPDKVYKTPKQKNSIQQKTEEIKNEITNNQEVKEEEEIIEDNSVKNNDTEINNKEKEITKKDNYYYNFEKIKEDKRKNKHKGISTSISANQSFLNTVRGSKAQNDYYVPPNSSSGTNPNEDKIKWDDANYYLPVSIALTVRKRITHKFSLESGLVYTKLKANSYREEAEIISHYVGIPLKGIFDFYRNNTIGVYSSVDATIEMNVAGKYIDEFGRKNLRVKKPQQSIGASFGFETKIIKPINIFTEAGCCYYFNDGTDLPTIRKENPFNVRFLLGLRFDIL